MLTCCGGTLLLRLVRVKRRLKRHANGLAKVGDAEDDEYHPLPPVEVPEHLKHVASFSKRTDGRDAPMSNETNAKFVCVKLSICDCYVVVRAPVP